MTEVLAQKKQVIKKSGLLEYCSHNSGFSHIGGLDLLKEWFRKRKQAYNTKGARFGLQPPKGVVLIGVPGCGKSLCAKALANEWNVALLRLDLGKIFSQWLGGSEANLRKALHIAEAVSPCVLWIDELEKAFSGLQGNQDSGVTQRVFGLFLEWLSEKTAPVFVVSTANDVRKLPPELLRRGRFDDVFFVGLPQEKERKKILQIHLEKRNQKKDSFSFDSLIKATETFSGAEIEEAVISGLYRAFEDKMRPLTTEDILESIKNIKPLALTRKNEIAQLCRWANNNARPAQIIKE